MQSARDTESRCQASGSGVAVGHLFCNQHYPNPAVRPGEEVVVFGDTGAPIGQKRNPGPL